MNINDFLTTLQQVPTDDLIRMASDITHKIDINVLADITPPKIPVCFPGVE